MAGSRAVDAMREGAHSVVDVEPIRRP